MGQTTGKTAESKEHTHVLTVQYTFNHPSYNLNHQTQYHINNRNQRQNIYSKQIYTDKSTVTTIQHSQVSLQLRSKGKILAVMERNGSSITGHFLHYNETWWVSVTKLSLILWFVRLVSGVIIIISTGHRCAETC